MQNLLLFAGLDCAAAIESACYLPVTVHIFKMAPAVAQGRVETDLLLLSLAWGKRRGVAPQAVGATLLTHVAPFPGLSTYLSR